MPEFIFLINLIYNFLINHIIIDIFIISPLITILFFFIITNVFKTYITNNNLLSIILWEHKYISLFFLVIGIILIEISLLIYNDYDYLIAWVTLYSIVMALVENSEKIKNSIDSNEENIKKTIKSNNKIIQTRITHEDRKLAIHTLKRIIVNLENLDVNICKWVIDKLKSEEFVFKYFTQIKLEFLISKYKSNDNLKNEENNEIPNVEDLESIKKNFEKRIDSWPEDLKFLNNEKLSPEEEYDEIDKFLDKYLISNEISLLRTISDETYFFFKNHYYYYLPDEIKDIMKDNIDECRGYLKNILSKIDFNIENLTKNFNNCENEKIEKLKLENENLKKEIENLKK